ncbi:MAG TPA: hypothetical protein VE135_06460 [Pyrinomonadaceae bacterium]|nr:hypothetical protein [Pyrinomonadaceae bacterium]
MSPFFLAFLLMLAAFLLLSLAAAARTIWLRLRPDGAPQLGVEQSPRYSNASDSLLLLAVAMCWYSVAAGWAGQLVCYPIYADMSAYGPQAFHGYSHGYLSRFASGLWPVGVMCLTWAILLWVPCRNVPKRLVWTIIALCVAFVVVTPFAAIAQDRMSAEGFSNDQYARLMCANGVRAIIFTLIGFLSLAAVRRRLTFDGSPGA